MVYEDDKDYLEDIKTQITIEQMDLFLAEIGAEPQVQGDIIKCKTICHGGDSHKLYYYNNTKLFKCFTQCPEDSFDIFQLILKIKKNDGLDWNFPKAISYISSYFGFAPKNQNFDERQENIQDWKILNNYDKNNSIDNNKQIVEMKIYDEQILKYLPRPRILPWEQEGISKDIIRQYGICYNSASQGIVIPHYNSNNELVGIRERTLIKENETNGKYKPAIIDRKMFNHPLGFNLYNLNNSKENIKQIQKAIVFEGEKSCLKYASFFGTENDISVAVCGSSMTMYQFKTLYELGIKELIIGFDKQFQKIGDEEYHRWKNKLIALANKFRGYCKISFLFDTANLLGYKDSPIDCGADIFLQLYKERLNSNGK